MVDVEATLRSSLDGRYAIEGEVGRGGMSVVYRARDLKHNRTVAIKVLKPELSEQIGADRFHREVEFAANLSNPHILPLFDSGEANGNLYYVMPCIEGGTLRDRIEREGALDVDEAIAIARNVASALEAAHEKEIVHRDIKPANILFSGGEAVVADFGIARAVTVEGGDRLTQTGLSIGSPAFMSPEQASGDPVDGRADLYSLGCVLFNMLVGEPPFVRDTAQATIAAQIAEPPPSVREARADVPKGVAEIILTALQKDPDDRFASATEMLEALDHPELMPERARERRRQKRIHTAATMLAVVVGVAGIGWLAWQAYAPEPLPDVDENRVMVFPLLERGGVEAGFGYDAAITIGNALLYADPLTFVSGYEWLDAEQRSDASLVTADVARAAALGKRARWYVTGTILGTADSSTVTLLLHDAVADTIAARKLAMGSADFSGIADAGLDATTRLLPVLLEPGREIDPSVLAASRSSNPVAMLEYLEGEKAYRASRFEEALGHYSLALDSDSTWAFGAIKAAQAASWVGEGNVEVALSLVTLALENRELLPPRYTDYAEGLRDYLTGAAHASAANFRKALEQDSAWAEARMALGEVYYHELPDWENPMPEAEKAFLRGWQADSSFVVPLYHLAEIAIRDGDLETARIRLDRYRAGQPESKFLLSVEAMLRCVSEGPASTDWDDLARDHWREVADAAVGLSAGAKTPGCAEAAFTALLMADSVSQAWRWGSQYALQSLWLVRGRDRDTRALVDSLIDAGVDGAYALYALNAIAGFESFEEVGAEAIAMLPSSLAGLDMGLVRFVGQWSANIGDIERLEEAVAAAAAIADSSGDPIDLVRAAGLSARLAAVQGDTSRALEILDANPPTGPRDHLFWDMDLSLPGERLLLAELLLARGEYERAISVAGGFEARPIVYLLYMRRSLEIRAEAAEAVGDKGQASEFRARLAELVGEV